MLGQYVLTKSDTYKSDTYKEDINKKIELFLAAYPETTTWRDPSTGNTLLHIAAAYANPKIVKLLAQHPSLVTSKNFADDTALELAEDAYEGAQTITALAQEVCNEILSAMHEHRNDRRNK
jgi:ankyrin repeat protein